MLTHLNSVTGVPVCRYSQLSRQPLNGEFNKATLCLAPTGNSLGEGNLLTTPHRRVYDTRIITRGFGFVKYFLKKFGFFRQSKAQKTHRVFTVDLRKLLFGE